MKRKECNSKIRLLLNKLCHLALNLLHLNISKLILSRSDAERKQFCIITSVKGRFAPGFYQLQVPGYVMRLKLKLRTPKLLLERVAIFHVLSYLSICIPRKNRVEVCGPLPKILTPFMTQICDFPHPVNDLTKNSIPYL